MMLRTRRFRRALSGAALAVCVAFAGEAATLAQQATPPDNSKVNARDRKPTAVTAESQKNDRTDIEITRDIRKALVADKSLSTYAHNIKVVTRNGKVTLKGPVRSESEKKIVEEKATEVAGASNVTNQISVAPAESAKKTPKKEGV